MAKSPGLVDDSSITVGTAGGLVSMRRSLMIGATLAVLQLACLAWGVDRAAAQAIPGRDGERTATLRDRLVFGLKARHPTEIAFLEEVATRVEAGQIPETLVDGTFLWVRKNKEHHAFPFIYFERLLRLQGTLLRVPIPAYNGPFR